MMPAKSTSDQRTYSWMTYGVAGIASRARPEREARRPETTSPGCRARLDARGRSPLPLGAQAVRAQPPPQRRATDPEPARGLCQATLRQLERLHDGSALALGQRRHAIPVRQEDRLAQLGGAVFQRAGAPAEREQPLAQRSAAQERRIAELREHVLGAVVGVEHAAVRVQDDDPLPERLDDRLTEGGEGKGGWVRGLRCHTRLHTRIRVQSFIWHGS